MSKLPDPTPPKQSPWKMGCLGSLAGLALALWIVSRMWNTTFHSGGGHAGALYGIFMIVIMLAVLGGLPLIGASISAAMLRKRGTWLYRIGIAVCVVIVLPIIGIVLILGSGP